MNGWVVSCRVVLCCVAILDPDGAKILRLSERNSQDTRLLELGPVVVIWKCLQANGGSLWLSSGRPTEKTTRLNQSVSEEGLSTWQ